MVKDTYACTRCKKTFSRKYNAERHNKLKHNEMAVVYNKETNWISNKSKTNIVRQQMQQEPSSSPSSIPPSSNPFSSTATTSLTPNSDNKNTVSKPYYDLFKDFNLEDQITEINKDTYIEKIYKIFEKISPLIDEFDVQLSVYKTPEERTKILSDAIILALSSANPVRSLKDIINLHHSIKGFRKASGFVAFTHKISLDQAQLMLKTIILTSTYSKNKFNN